MSYKRHPESEISVIFSLELSYVDEKCRQSFLHREVFFYFSVFAIFFFDDDRVVGCLVDLLEYSFQVLTIFLQLDLQQTLPHMKMKIQFPFSLPFSEKEMHKNFENMTFRLEITSSLFFTCFVFCSLTFPFSRFLYFSILCLACRACGTECLCSVICSVLIPARNCHFWEIWELPLKLSLNFLNFEVLHKPKSSCVLRKSLQIPVQSTFFSGWVQTKKI